MDPPLISLGLRNPEKDAKTERDYLRVSFQEEDEAWRVEQQRYTLTMKEMKRLDHRADADL